MPERLEKLKIELLKSHEQEWVENNNRSLNYLHILVKKMGNKLVDLNDIS